MKEEELDLQFPGRENNQFIRKEKQIWLIRFAVCNEGNKLNN